MMIELLGFFVSHRAILINFPSTKELQATISAADQPIFEATVPSKVQAYMAAGRPIVACLNREGERLVSEANAGLSVPAEDANALAEAVLQLYRMSPEEREKLGQNGRAYYREHFDYDRLVEQLIHHLHELTLSFGKK